MRGKFHPTRWLVVFLSIVVGLASIGVSYACFTGVWAMGNLASPSYCSFRWVVSNDNGKVEKVSPYWVIDPDDNGLDPNQYQAVSVNLPPSGRYNKDVACTTAVLERDPCYSPYSRYITVTVSEAYPSYWPTIFYGIKNTGRVPIKIKSIVVDENYTGVSDNSPNDITGLTVAYGGICVGQIIDAGKEAVGNLVIHVEQEARQGCVYKIGVKIGTKVEKLGGTPGFWRGGTPDFWRNNWGQFYKQTRVLQWLRAINVGSKWISDPTPRTTWTINDMYTIFDAGNGQGATAKTTFLRDYLATRLNARCVPPRLRLGNICDVHSYDPGNYLRLAHPEAATLNRIFAAIESKYGTSPTNNQYAIMNNICHALNQQPPEI